MLKSLKNIFKSKETKYLEQVSYKDVKFFNFEGYGVWAKCVKVYDGDTGTFVFFYNNKPYKFRMRLAEIDTAEMKSQNKKEIEHALKAKNRLIELIDDKLVYIECLGYEKYGRILVNIYAKKNYKKSFNQILLDERLAYKYDGGKKMDFDEWQVNIMMVEVK